MADYHPGTKTWLLALLTSFWTYRKTRNFAVDLIFKTLRRLLMTLPHARRSKLIKAILGKPTLTSRKLLKASTLPHGSQWNHIAPSSHGHWYIKHIQRKAAVAERAAEVAAMASDLVILYFHGGGFRVGTSVMYSDSFLLLLDRLEKAHDVKSAILSLEYGLVPEHTWYSLMDQAHAAYLYLLDLGIPASKIIIGGDSAGGHMTGMLLPRLKDEGHPLPLGGMLISPLVTFDSSAPSFSAHAAFDCLPDSMVRQDLTDLFPELKTIATNEEEVRQQHLAKVSPINSNMTGLPPLLVSFGQRERFANDVEQYIARLVRHGVDVHVVSRHNEPHVYIVTPLLASSLRVWAKDCALLADWCSQRVKQSDVY